MTLAFIFLVVGFALLLGALPAWPHRGGRGYYSGGVMGLIVATLIVLLLTERR